MSLGLLSFHVRRRSENSLDDRVHLEKSAGDTKTALRSMFALEDERWLLETLSSVAQQQCKTKQEEKKNGLKTTKKKQTKNN